MRIDGVGPNLFSMSEVMEQYAGRNILIGPGLENFDAGLFKDIPVRESKRFQIRWQLFNSLNRANFGNPNASFASSNFGRILSAGSPRIMQLALKFYY